MRTFFAADAWEVTVVVSESVWAQSAPPAGHVTATVTMPCRFATSFVECSERKCRIFGTGVEIGTGVRGRRRARHAAT